MADQEQIEQYLALRDTNNDASLPEEEEDAILLRVFGEPVDGVFGQGE